MRLLFWLICAAAPLGAEDFSYWIEPCTSETSHDSGCLASDPELARWALGAWKQAARPALAFPPGSEDHARLKFYWATRRNRLYGEAHPILVDGKRGSAIFVNPDISQLGEEIFAAASHDRLLRDAIVYLTCLHESGHGLGLSHTGKFEDIMYSFGYGGDIPEYFARYRRLLASREDIRTHSGLSAYDRTRVLDLFRAGPAALR